MSIKVNSARKEMNLLTEAFRSRKSFLPKDRHEIYRQLVENKNIDLDKSILITWLPEGDNFYSGGIIDQYGQILWFDINVENPVWTEWSETYPLSEYEKTHDFKTLKPWDYMKIAIELWHELHNPSLYPLQA